MKQLAREGQSRRSPVEEDAVADAVQSGTFGRPRWAWLVAICAAMTLLADFLFYGHTLGASAGLYLLGWVGVLHALGGAGLRQRVGRMITAALLGLVMAMAIYPSAIALLLAVLGVATLAMLRRNASIRHTGRWLFQLLHLAIMGSVAFVADSRVARRWRRRQGSAGSTAPRAIRVAVAWLLPIGLGLCFVLLFAAANPVIERWLTALRDAVTRTDFDWLPRAGRVVFWLVSGVAIYALLRWRPRRLGLDAPEENWLPQPPPEACESATMARFAVRCLVVFNAVFGVQSLLDAWYLLGGGALPEGMTYAQYAHRGAYPLVATALLAGAFVLLLFQPGRDGGTWRIAQRMVYVWLLQNVFLVGTAAWRLGLYVDVYSLTRLRVAAGIWMLLIALGLVWIIVRIVQRRSNVWLMNVNTLTLLVVLYGCAFVNFDAVIANYNVRHCQEVTTRFDATSLDVAYLDMLGADALPAMRWARSALAKDHPLQRELSRLIKLRESELDQLDRDWRSWCLRREWQRDLQP